MKKIIWVLTIILLLTSLSHGKHVAFLTETAPGGNINSQKDIHTMKRILGDGYEFIVMNAKEATSVNIRKKFEELSKSLGEEDTFVFYYSGHGNRFYSSDGDEPDGHDDFLLTSDYHCSDGSNVINVLADDELNYLYAQIKARKIIIIDACHSASMHKSSFDFSSVKQFKGCSQGLTTRAFDLDPSYRKAQNENFLHFAAAEDNNSALGSKDGGVFTLKIEEVLKEKGNISFQELEQAVQNKITSFQPSITQDSTIDKSKLFTKEIFFIAKTNSSQNNAMSSANHLASLLNQKPKTIKVVTQDDKTAYPLNKSVPIKGYFNKSNTQHVYLLEVKDKNDFTLIATKPLCLDYTQYGYNQMCQFTNLQASKPIGKSTIYMLKTNQALDLGNKKDSIITESFFDTHIPLFEQLQKRYFEVGKINISTY